MIPLFLDFLQVCIGTKRSMCRVPSEEEWNLLFKMTASQGVQRLCAPCLTKGIMTESGADALSTMPETMSRDWINDALQLAAKNLRINKECSIVEIGLLQRLEEARVSILKGQGLAPYYVTAEGEYLGAQRESGDIDVWVDGGWSRLLSLARMLGSKSNFDYKHIHIPVLRRTAVELHWRPSSMTDLVANHRLQKFFSQYQEEMVSVLVSDAEAAYHYHSPSVRINRILLLTHSYGHFVNGELRMKQMLDYYFVVKQPIDSSLKSEEVHLIDKLHLKKYASALAWVLCRLDSNLTEEVLPFAPNEKEGRFLLEQIFSSPPKHSHNDSASSARRMEMITKWWRQSRKIWSHCPGEVLWWPVWKLAMFVWKRAALLKIYFDKSIK